MPDRQEARSTPLSPADGFVLSRVDGKATDRDIAQRTGLDPTQVEISLARLEAFGFITFERPGASPAEAATETRASAHTPVLPPLAAPAAATAPAPRPSGPIRAGPSFVPADGIALTEEVDLDIDMRRELVAAYGQLDRLDHYRLLGIERTADKKAVKRAYYELAAKFHPDKHFRKNLGSYKARMEAIFNKLTFAHDTLSDKVKRAEYDAYIDEQRRLAGIEQILADTDATVLRAEQEVEREIGAKEPPNVDVNVRRDAFARRLLGSRRGDASSAPPSAVPSSPATRMTPTEAVNALRNRYEERVRAAKRSQSRKYAAQGYEALAADQIVIAANAFNVASGLAPDDVDLARKAREVADRANVLLGDTYARQAQYEEKSGQWREAARSWLRACRARPNDANTHDSAAAAIVRAAGDLHEAARLAQRACELVPERPHARVTLATVYLAAGLSQNARRELQAAARMAPDDKSIEAMLLKLSASA